MTHDEMIAVIRAHNKGGQIQYKPYNQGPRAWKDCRDNKPSWDFVHFDFRIKPESQYRPFRYAKEVMEAVEKHGVILHHKDFAYRYFVISEWDNTGIWIASFEGAKTYEETFKFYTFADGTPFGFKED